MLDKEAQNLLFLEARTYPAWQERDVTEELLKKAYDLARMGSTASNSCPLRIVFVRSKEAKERLRPLLSPGNVEKTMGAPVTAILCYDLAFYEKMDRLAPHMDARARFEGKEETNAVFAFRSGTLQAAYFLLACRAVGLDCGPMSGFKNALVDEAFLEGTRWKSNILMNIGYGDKDKARARQPRLEFDEACRID